MTRPPLNEQWAMAEKVRPSTHWLHRKSQGHYEVIAVAEERTEDSGLMVVYRLVGGDQTYVRTIEDFVAKFTPDAG